MLQAHEGELLNTELSIFNKKGQKVTKFDLVFIYK